MGGLSPPRDLGRVPLVRPALGGGDELHVPAVYEQPDVLAALLVEGNEGAAAAGGGTEGGGGDAAEADEPETVRLIQYAHGLSGKEGQAAGGVVADVGATAASLVLPGSFNPLHRGHKELLAVAAKMRPGRTPAYELSATNVDKPPLPPATLRSRVEAILATPPPHPLPPAVVLVTAAPLFEQKARLLPGTTFVIGVDTAVRLVDAAYYGGSEAAMVASLAAIAGRGCDFLVAARVDARTGRLATLADVAVPGGASGPFGRLFEAVPTAAFRADVSSTQIRKQGGGGAG